MPSSISRTRTTSRDARRLTPAALLALLLALVVALTGCGIDADVNSDAGSEASGSSFPVTVTGSNGDLTGYEATFAAQSEDLPIDVHLFCGHREGKPAVVMKPKLGL